MNDLVKDKYLTYPPKAKKRLLELRSLVLQVAKKTKGVGSIKEDLKWNEPSFITEETKSGSTFRINWKKNDPERFHIYFNCNTRLIRMFKRLFPDDFDYGGNRSISFQIDEKLPKTKLSKCIELALTYNLKKG